jgi:hypothetical protein
VTRLAYSATSDLLIGDVQLPAGKDGTKYVDQASDEIDSRLGFTYATPFDVSDSSAVSRPAILLLKTLNIWISSGRAMMDLGTSGENGAPNAYGKYLLTEAEAMLTLIQEGRIILDGAAPASPDSPVEFSSRVLISNVDPYSMVEAFYGWAAKPTIFRGGGPDIGGIFSDGSIPYPFGSY